MAVIRKKIWPGYFELLASGKKKFEARLADFDVKEGDIFVLEEWDPQEKQYTGRTIQKEVDFVFKFKLDDFGQKREIEDKGMYIIQLK